MRKFSRLGIVGLGLMGGSLARAIKRGNLADEVVGFSRRIKTLKKAKKLGWIDIYQLDFQKGVSQVDFLILATPIGVLENYFQEIKTANPKLLVTDVSSVKDFVVKQAEKILGKENNFVGSHPITGSEKSGLDYAPADLFQGRVVILTPTRATDKKSLKKVADFWELLGSKVVYLSPKEHDRILGLTSHLPHLLAFTLAGLLQKEVRQQALKYCIGPGFLDTTRIARSSPDLWTEIFLYNRKNIAVWSRFFCESLVRISRDISTASDVSVQKQLAGAQQLREKVENIKRQRE